MCFDFGYVLFQILEVFYPGKSVLPSVDGPSDTTKVNYTFAIKVSGKKVCHLLLMH